MTRPVALLVCGLMLVGCADAGLRTARSEGDERAEEIGLSDPGGRFGVGGCVGMNYAIG